MGRMPRRSVLLYENDEEILGESDVAHPQNEAFGECNLLQDLEPQLSDAGNNSRVALAGHPAEHSPC